MTNEREQLVSFIRNIFMMPLAHAEDIASRFQLRTFQKQDFLLKEGRPCRDYYFLENGYARAFTHNLYGEDVTTSFYSPGQVVCELYAFFKRIPSKENIQALCDCRTWFIGYNELQDAFHSLPSFREFGRSILVNSYAFLKARMLSMLQETAEERYAHLMKNNPDIFQHAPLKQIASYLGVTDSSLSRIRRNSTFS